MMDGKKMWNMALMEQTTWGEWLILRVPGGWIMREAHAPNAAYVFVPLDNEFVASEPTAWEDFEPGNVNCEKCGHALCYHEGGNCPKEPDHE